MLCSTALWALEILRPVVESYLVAHKGERDEAEEQRLGPRGDAKLPGAVPELGLLQLQRQEHRPQRQQERGL